MQSIVTPPQQLFREIVGQQHFADLLTACAGGRERYQGWYLPMAEKLALCVQDLPLSPGAFNQRGGALQFGLAAGLLTVRMCDATIFNPKATAQERQAQDPLYRWCAYCATLASAFLVCAGEVQVTLLEGGEVYSFASDETLGSKKGQKFASRWKSQPALPAQAGMIYLGQFFYGGQFEHLAPDMLSMMGGAINPAMATAPVESPMARVVRQSLEQVLDARRKADAALISGGTADPMLSVAAAAAPSVATAQPPSASAPASAAQERTEGAQAPAKPAASPASTLPRTLLDWIKTVALNPELHSELEPVEEGRIKISKKVLSFAGTVKENYGELHAAKLVFDKNPNFVICTKEFGQLIESFRAAAAGGAK